MNRWGERGPNFNYRAAETVYKALAAMDDDEAQVMGRMLVGATVQHDLLVHGAELAKAHDELAKRQVGVLRKNLSRDILAKSRAGESATEQMRALNAVLEVSKAFDGNYSRDEEGHFASVNTLQSGRLARDHRHIVYSPTLPKPLKGAHAAQLGIPNHSHLTSAEDRARFQQAYGQVRDMVRPFADMGERALVHLHVRKPDGSMETRHADINGGEPKLDEHIGQGERLHSVSVSVMPPMTAAGAAYDGLAAMGAPGLGGYAYNAVDHGVGNTEKLRDFRTNGLDKPQRQEDFIPSARVFHNLGAGSKMLNDSLGPNGPMGLKFALKVGEHVGNYGPEAQRVIGPTADKAAYRYRGTERAVSNHLGNALMSIKRDPRLQSGSARREHLLHGSTGPEGNFVPSAVLNFFRGQLPDVALNDLQLKSGHTPPSKGIIINGKGQVDTESVGYGDDHYLPFNLKRLGALKGGEYIRTRTYGGPTTEDIYTGLVSGAHGLTVVSHNGVYTVDFSNDLRGGRRFNDKAARMVGRYGHLLDAVQSEQAQRGKIDPSRMEELRTKANARFNEDRNPTGFANELKSLQDHEMKHPTLSKDQRAQATLDFFNGKALGVETGGNVANPDTLVDAYVNLEAASRLASHAKEVAGYNRFAPKDQQMAMSRDLPALKAEVRGELTDGDDAVKMGARVADKMGWGRQLDAALKNADAENRKSLSPLKLNGEGYAVALDALKEQFPHYIDRVKFHAWDQSKASPGQTDTGYVRPNHNRAAEALAGYFDQHASRHKGARKVYADSTRWQNRNESVRAYNPDGTTRADTKATASAPGGDRADSFLKEQAEDAFHDSLLAATHFGPQVNIAGAPNDALANTPIADSLADANGKRAIEAAMPNTVRLLGLTPEARTRERETAPARWSSTIRGAQAEQRQTKAFDGLESTLSGLDRGGRAAPARKVGGESGDWSKELNHTDSDHDLDGSDAFLAHTEPTPEAIRDIAYREDPAIQDLVSSKRLPSMVDDPSFRPAADALVSELKDQLAEHTERIKNGVPWNDIDWGPLDLATEGVVRAKQLSRNYGKALARAKANFTESAPTSTVSVHFAGAPGDVSEEDLKAGQEAYQRAIQGQ